MKVFFLLIFIFILSSCSFSPKEPLGIENACDIIKTDPSWKDAFFYTYKKYNVRPSIIMSFIYQESRFKYDRRSSREQFWGIPLGYKSTSYGFSQALDGTWEWYQKKTSNYHHRRDSLPDSVEFIGWYISYNSKRLGINKNDAFRHYLAYHEGTTGYLKKSYKRKDKRWLIGVAQKVEKRAKKYSRDLSRCNI